MQSTAGFDVCWQPQLRWSGKHHAAGASSCSALAWTPTKGWAAFAFELASRSCWQHWNTQCLIYSWKRGCGGGKPLWLIYQLYLDCTRITASIRRRSVLDPSVPRQQSAWPSARALKVRRPRLSAISLAAISGASSWKSSYTAWILLLAGYSYPALASEIKRNSWCGTRERNCNQKPTAGRKAGWWQWRKRKLRSRNGIAIANSVVGNRISSALGGT